MSSTSAPLTVLLLSVLILTSCTSVEPRPSKIPSWLLQGAYLEYDDTFYGARGGELWDRARLHIQVTKVEADVVTYRYKRQVQYTIAPGPNEHDLLHRLNLSSGKDIQVEPKGGIFTEEFEPENTVYFIFNWWLQGKAIENHRNQMTKAYALTRLGSVESWLSTDTQEGASRKEWFEANTGLLVRYEITEPGLDARRVIVLEDTNIEELMSVAR